MVEESFRFPWFDENAFRIISPHSGPFTSSRPTQSFSLCLAPLRAFQIISPHSGPSASSRPTQGLSLRLAPLGPFISSQTTQGLLLHLAPLRAFLINSPHSGPSASSHPTQGLSHHLALLRAFHFVSSHTGPFHHLAPLGPSASSCPTQGLSLRLTSLHLSLRLTPHHFTPLRAFHIISPRSGRSTSSRPIQGLPHRLAFFFNVIDLFVYLFTFWGVLLIITRLLASPFSCCVILLKVVFLCSTAEQPAYSRD